MPGTAPAAPSRDEGTTSVSSADERALKREAARQERTAAARTRQQAKRRKKLLTFGLAPAVLAAGTLFTVQRSLSSKNALARAARAAGCGPVQEFADEGTRHLQANQTYRYKTNPPTSGPHAVQPAPWGSQAKQTPDQTLVHNLEHGGVIVHYNGLPNPQVDKLESAVDSYRDGVVSNPNPKIDGQVVLTSWRKMRKCEKYSPEVVQAYVKQNCGKGPEKVVTCSR